MTEASKKKEGKLIWCDQCEGNYCHNGYQDKKPDYCQAAANPDLLQAVPELYEDPEAAKFQRAASKLLNRQKQAGVQWPRIQESIEFAKELQVKKVGIAVCISMSWQGSEFAQLMRLAGLEPCMVTCMAGGLKQEQLGVPKDWSVPPCNPIVQAEILNREGTEFNFIYGLCVGHDTLFIQHSKAPVSVVLVKDRVTVNNPGAVLYSFYHRNRLWAEYGGDPGHSKI